MDVISRMHGGRSESVKFDSQGDVVTGTVLEVREVQMKDDGVPEVWKEGVPRMTPIFVLQTEEMDDEDDDGRRTLFARSGIYTAISNALRETFKKGTPTSAMILGSEIRVEWVDTVPARKKGHSDRKIYDARIHVPV